MKSVLMLFVCLLSGTSFASPASIVRRPNAVKGRYIVVLADQPAPPAVPGIARSLAAGYRLEVLDVYPHAPHGFLASASEASVAALSNDPRVAYIEQDAMNPRPSPRLSARYFFPSRDDKWYLDRIDNATFSQGNHTYSMCPEATSITAYVVDSGVFEHGEFAWGYGMSIRRQLNFVRHEVAADKPYPADDKSNGCTGYPETYHGTAVAALIGGRELGASHAKIESLRVIGCNTNSSFTSDLIKALDWLAKREGNEALGVVNLSYFVPPYDTEFSAVGDSIDAIVNQTQMPVFTSADNYSTDVCSLFSPKHRGYNPVTRPNGSALVVGGSMILANTDYRWQEYNGSTASPMIGEGSGSNAGDCVGVYAPAHNIPVALNTNQSQYATGSGTSFASAIAAGVGARFIEWFTATRGRKPTAKEVYYFISTADDSGTVQNPPPFYGNVVLDTGMPTYTICFREAANGNFYPLLTGCVAGNSTDHFYNMQPPSSNAFRARMLHWQWPHPSEFCDDEITWEYW